MNTLNIDLECECGALKGHLRIPDKSQRTHLRCYCKDCQSYAKKIGAYKRVFDKNHGTEILQTYPAYLTFTQGKENISKFKLSPKGIARWYTSCCNLPSLHHG